MVFGDADGPGSFGTITGAFARMSDGTMIIAEVNQVPVAFDRTGKYLRRLGRRGKGPGEFDGYVGQIRVQRGDTLMIANGAAFSTSRRTILTMEASWLTGSYRAMSPVSSTMSTSCAIRSMRATFRAWKCEK
jgi:hypothetical protein